MTISNIHYNKQLTTFQKERKKSLKDSGRTFQILIDRLP